MRETPKAQQAWNDYLGMGAGRSLEKLVECYQTVPSPPTRRLPTLKLWSRDFGWQARLDTIAREQEHAIRAEGIANKQNRVAALNDRWQRMQLVIQERSEDYDTDHVPGGQSGLLVRQVKQVGVGQNASMVTEYVVDTGLLKEMREHEKQAAQELGQWTEKKELTGKDGAPVAVSHQLDLSKLTNEELRALEQLVGKTAND